MRKILIYCKQNIASVIQAFEEERINLEERKKYNCVL